MATIYVDPAATGDADGTTWTHAYTNLQTAVSAVSGTGNIIYCRGTQTLTSGGTVSITTSGIDAGTNQAPNQIIGCNASGDVDGTRFVLTGNNKSNGDTTAHGLILVANSWLVKNIECKEMGGSGIYTQGSGNKHINCSCSANGVAGFNVYSVSDTHRVYIQCVAYNNAGFGFDGSRGGMYLFCCAHDNTSYGFHIYQQLVFGCLAYDNGTYGFYEGFARSTGIINCVAHGNGSDGFYSTGAEPLLLLGNRATSNGGYGIEIQDSTSEFVFDLYNYASGNTSGEMNTGIAAWGVVSIGSLTSGTTGYTSTTDGSEDFNLTDSASLRRTAITIPTS